MQIQYACELHWRGYHTNTNSFGCYSCLVMLSFNQISFPTGLIVYLVNTKYLRSTLPQQQLTANSWKRAIKFLLGVCVHADFSQSDTRCNEILFRHF